MLNATLIGRIDDLLRDLDQARRKAKESEAEPETGQGDSPAFETYLPTAWRDDAKAVITEIHPYVSVFSTEVADIEARLMGERRLLMDKPDSKTSELVGGILGLSVIALPVLWFVGATMSLVFLVYGVALVLVGVVVFPIIVKRAGSVRSRWARTLHRSMVIYC